MIPLLHFILVIQTNLDSASKYAQVSLAILAYLGVGGSFAGWYINYRITKFERELFDRMDAKFTTKEICNLRHKIDPDWGKGTE
jgi:hypothetical protein